MSNQELLREYAGRQSEAAFAELVRRHLDLVYSAALRMVRDSSLAEDVTQGVFLALAQNARQLAEHPVLAGWLHRTTQNLSSKAVRSEVRRRAREQEVAAMSELSSTEPDATWEQIAPQLDDALGELSELDRDALLLRYFQRRSAREIGQMLGLSDEAAQKRVSRAVERLRDIFAKRGATVAVSGLVAILSTKAVHAAPPGLFATITSTTTAATITVTKALIMTTIQKTAITVAIIGALGAGIYESRKASNLQNRVETLQQRLIVAGSSNNAVLATLQGKLDSLTASNAELASALVQANADKTRLEDERERAKHSATLFKELADQVNAKEKNSTNDYPTPRHVWAGWGKFGRLAVQVHKDEDELSPEEKAVNNTARLAAVGELANLVKAMQQLGMGDSSGTDSFKDNPADAVSCLLYGALNLNEQQFGQVYGVLEKYHQQAKQDGLLEENSPPETAAELKGLFERAQGEIRAFLSPDQASMFEQIAPHLKVESRKFDFNFNL